MQGMAEAPPPMAGGPAQAGLPPDIVPRGLPLQLEVLVLRATPAEQGHTVAPIADGEVLRDGRGNPAAGDTIKILFRTDAPCYVYVVAIDGSGFVKDLFTPAPGSEKPPVVPNRDYTIPEGNEWGTLDEVRGVETLYVLASPGPRPDIEQALRAVEVRPRSIGPITAKVEEAAILPADYGGIGLGRSAVIGLESGRQMHVTPLAYVATQAGDDLRVTRWFRHE